VRGRRIGAGAVVLGRQATTERAVSPSELGDVGSNRHKTSSCKAFPFCNTDRLPV
jgi:hypothetical protein